MLDIRERYNVIPYVLIPGEGELAEKCRENNIHCFVVPFWGWLVSTSVKFSGRCKTLAKFFIKRLLRFHRVYNAIKAQSFDIVHTNSTVVEIGDTLARRLGLPHIWNLMEFGKDDYNIDYLLPRKCVYKRYSRANAVIAISSAVYDNFVRERRLCSPDNTRMIYLGLRVPPSYDKNTDKRKINFCITGGVWSGKNQIMAIKACVKLKALTDKFTLHIVGACSEQYLEELQNFIHSNGIDEHVKFWGFRYDVNDVLKTMDVGLMLSKREAFGRVTVEYMLNYMPVIGVNSGATPEIVADNKTGYICPLDDTDKLAELMHKFIETPEIIRTMGKRARDHAEKNFSLEKNTDDTYRLYREILGRK